ncbi:hypothetical protein [Achromobacter insolitus]|uniref:hypothetical protein n=1 Tax=Achromobacter insolitus TaxID=217204 RepID=UPI00174A32A7|nr:hypothetical protein [Achromobacter insolitus]
MSRKANVLLEFDNPVQVTIADDGKWIAAGDPKSVLEEHEGKWIFNPTAGTTLTGPTADQVTLVGWRLSSTTKGEEGAAYRFPKQANELGKFTVQQVEDF